MDQELYHHGVKGMKWGVRKRPKSTEKLYKQSRDKIYKKTTKLLKKDKAKNMKSAIDKMNAELENTKVYKDYKDTHALVKKKVKSEGATLKEINSLGEKQAAVYKKMQSIAKKYKNEYAGAMLKDLGYEDTKAGREYIKKLMG